MFYNTNRVFLNASNVLYKTAPTFLLNPFQPGIYKIVYRRQGLLQVESMNGHIQSFAYGFVAKEYFTIHNKYIYLPMSGNLLSGSSLDQFYVKDEIGNGYSADLPNYVKEGDYMWFVYESLYPVRNNIQMA